MRWAVDTQSVTVAVDPARAVADVGREPHHRAARLWVHVVALTILLIALFPLMRPTSSFTSDEGAYALQAKALEQGSWAYDYRAADLDPEGRAFPIVLSESGPSGHFTYVKHPTVPLVLYLSTKLVGRTVGLHLLSLLGVIGAAVAAWLLAAEIDPRLRRPAFWLAAGGPVLVNGFVIWAHAPSAAVAGFAMLGAARAVRWRFTPLAAAGMTAALALGVLLRSEGLLFAGALAVAVAGVRLHRTRRPVAAIATIGLLLGSAILVSMLERLWISSILGGPYGGVAGAGAPSSSFWGDRLGAAWHVLLQGSYVDPRAELPMLLVLVVVVGLGVPALRHWGPTSASKLAVAVVMAVVLLAVRFASFSFDPVTGLLPAAPLLAMGVLLFRRRDSGPVGGLLIATVGMFTLAILATQYPEGGGLEWGGRFLSPALVPLAVLAASGLARACELAPSADRTRVIALLAGLGVVTSAFSMATTGALRAHWDATIAAVSRHPSPVSVTSQPATPRGAWRADRLTWMLADESGVPELMRILYDRGVPQVTVIVDRALPRSAMAPYPILEEQDEPALRRNGLQIVVARM